MLQRQDQDRTAAAPECFFNHINSYYVWMNVCYIPILFLWCLNLKKKWLFSCFITYTSGEHSIVLLADCSGCRGNFFSNEIHCNRVNCLTIYSDLIFLSGCKPCTKMKLVANRICKQTNKQQKLTVGCVDSEQYYKNNICKTDQDGFYIEWYDDDRNKYCKYCKCGEICHE